MNALESYFEALRGEDWERLATCVAPDVHRVGPYLDEIRGRDAYISFLAKVIPSLPNYDLQVDETRTLDDGAALVRLREILDVDGVRTEFPEVILFQFDPDRKIVGIDIYIKSTSPR